MPATSRQTGAAWQTYADELAILGHGIALWQPAPLHNYKRINIGDVGYVRQGRFHLLFSAAQPLGNRQLGVDVPRDFVPINPGPTVKDQPRVPGALHTQYIEQKGAGISASSDIACIEVGTTLRFESSSRKGAILLTKYKTFCENAERLGFFKEYILRHQQSWVDYANKLGHMVTLDDIVLVTGHDMTLDFAMLAFSSNFRQIGMEFEAGLPAVASASTSVWGMWRTSTSVHRNCGPQHREPPTSHSRLLSTSGNDLRDDILSEYNQCVFVRGFRIRKRAGVIPTVIRAAAGFHDLGSGKRDDERGPLLRRNPSETAEPDSEVIHDTPMFVDPMEPIFRYIFENSKAHTAVVHDIDLSNLLKLAGTPTVKDIDALIPKLSPRMIEVTRDGTASIKTLEMMGTPPFFRSVNLPLGNAVKGNYGHPPHIQQHSSSHGVSVSRYTQHRNGYAQLGNSSQAVSGKETPPRNINVGSVYNGLRQTEVLPQSDGPPNAFREAGHTPPVMPKNPHVQPPNLNEPRPTDRLQTTSVVGNVSHAPSTPKYLPSESSAESSAFPYERFPSPPSRGQVPPIPVTSTSWSSLSKSGSPEIKLDLDFSSESLFDGFPSTMFGSHRSSSQQVPREDNTLPPIKIPPTIPSPISESGSVYSDFSYVSAPDIDWGVSPGESFPPRPHSASSPRLTRQDSATLPIDRDREALFAGRHNSPERRRRHSHAHSSWRHSHHTRRHSSRPGSIADLLSPVEPMPEDATTRARAMSRRGGGMERSRSRSRHRKSKRRSTLPSTPSIPMTPARAHSHAYAWQQPISEKGYEGNDALRVDSDEEMLQFGDVLDDSLDDYMAEFVQLSPPPRVVPLSTASGANKQPPTQSLPSSPEQGAQVDVKTEQSITNSAGQMNKYNDKENRGQGDDQGSGGGYKPQVTRTDSTRARRPLPLPPISPPRTFQSVQRRQDSGKIFRPGSKSLSLDASSQYLYHTTDVRASQFPETPQELSPILSPPASAYVLSVPVQRSMPKPPIIDPAPPPRRQRDRPPLPIGPRKPSVRVATPARPGQNVTAAMLPEFKSENVRWRGATMDAAKWTFTTAQLQNIVGRAIRQSAKTSSIRLLTLDVLDGELPGEIRRLENLREDMKGQYREAVRRRQVLLQQLAMDPDAIDWATRAEITQELVDLSEMCDTLSEDLYRVMDELQQINRLYDVHSASALAMALRKLNSSFMKQTANMTELRAQRAQLEAERDEAWATAERVERDLVDLQAKMEVLSSAASRPNSTIPSTRSSRVSAARKTSLRASKASLRFSRGALRSSHSSPTTSNRLSVLSHPMPHLPHLQPLSLNTDLPFGEPYTMGLSSTLGNTPTSEARELQEAQNELYMMLGLTSAELRRDASGRYRRASEMVSPSSVPASPFPLLSGKGASPVSDVLAQRRRKASF